RVRSILQAKNCLVILDNVASTSELELLLPSEGRCATLVTLRDRDIASAFEGDLLRLAPFDIRESMTFLVEMLGLARVQAEEAASNRLINFAAGLPLILRLIGGTILSTDSLSLAEYAKLLQDKLAKLPDWEVLADQERKVRATFEVSFQRLLPALQPLFASLGLFQARHFSVAAVAHLNQLSPAEATLYLTRLTRAALIQPMESLAGDTATSGRYQIHTLLQLFAFAKLSDVSTPLSDWRARLHDYYTQFVSRHSGAAIDVEWINVAGMLQTALAGEDKGQLAALIQPLTEAEVSNIGYMDSRGQYGLALSCLTALLTDEKTLDQAAIHYKCGVFARRLARHEQAPDFLKRSLELLAPYAPTAALALSQAAVYEQLGRYYQQRDIEEAMDHVMAGLELLTTYESETANIQRNALLNVQAAVMFHSGVDRQAAIRVAENALASLGEAQNLVRLNLLINLANLYAQVSDMTRAYQHTHHGLTIARELGNKRKIAALVSNKGALERRQGQISEALQTIEDARQLFVELADFDNVGTSLNNLAMLYYQLEQDETAEACLAEALDLAEAHGLDELKLFVLTTWSKIHIRAGAYDKAAAQLAECDRLIPVNTGGTSFYLLPYINLHKGRLSYQRGQMDDAIRYLELAIREGRTQDRETVGLAQATYAELLVDLKQLESVKARYEEALAILVDHDVYEQALAQRSYAIYLRTHESASSGTEIAELMASADRTLAKFQPEP
ncbi:MAG: hypothetical protein KDE04_15690, partial [Anaerolineales bacterium]|nr:hypothetical protein [Anaerolineales bacterium]